MSLLDEVAEGPEEVKATGLLDEVTQSFSTGELAVGVLDVAANVGASSAAEVAGGVAGLGTLAATGDESAAVAVQEGTADKLTFEPQTDAGKMFMNKLAELMQPVAELVDSAQTAAGDSTFSLGENGGDETSAALGAVAQTLPTAATMLIPGVRPALNAVRKQDLGADVRKGRADKAAQAVEPDLDVVQAADRLEIPLDPGTVSTNKSFVELTQSLKARPGNPLTVAELEAIEALGEKGRALVGQDRAEFSDAVKSDFEQTIASLNAETHKLHEGLVDRTVPVDLDESSRFMVQMLDEVGSNTDALTRPERDLMALVDKEQTTYGALDRIRRNVGMAYNGRGPYKDVDDGILDQVYGALSRDQLAKADELGVGEQLRLANKLVEQRKDLEAQTLQLFGRNLDRTLISKISGTGGAKGQLAKGDLTAFRKLMDTLPEKFRKDGAALVIDSLMGDNRGKFSLGGFAGVVDSFKRNPQVKREVLRYLDPDERQTFEDLSTVATAIQRTKSRENSSGTGKTILAAIESPNAMQKLYQGARDVAAAESVGSSAGVPGAGTLGVIASKRLGSKKDPADAATELLTSERFRVALRKITAGKIDDANRVVTGSREYRNWVKQHPIAAKEIPIIGFFGWLSSQDESPSDAESPDL